MPVLSSIGVFRWHWYFYGTELFQQTLRFQLFLLQKDGKGVVGYGELQFIVLLGEVGVLVFQVFLFQVEFLHQLVVGAFFLKSAIR
mgnify:CR=1 FL=1